MDYRNSMSLTTMCGHEHDSYATIVSMRSPITGMSRVMEGRSISKDPRNTKRCWGLWEPYREKVPTRRGTTTPYSMTTTGEEVNRKLDRALCSVPCPQSTRGGRRRSVFHWQLDRHLKSPVLCPGGSDQYIATYWLKAHIRNINILSGTLTRRLFCHARPRPLQPIDNFYLTSNLFVYPTSGETAQPTCATNVLSIVWHSTGSSSRP